MSTGRRQLRQEGGGNTEISTGDTTELVKYRGATPEDIVNDLEGAEEQPKDKVMQSIVENMEYQITGGSEKQTIGWLTSSNRDQKCVELDTTILLRTKVFILSFDLVDRDPRCLRQCILVVWMLEDSETVNYTHCMSRLASEPKTVNSFAEPSE